MLKVYGVGTAKKEPGGRYRIAERAFALVMLLGTVVRFCGIGHDLPFIYDPDEPTFIGGARKIANLP